jgi:Ca-activated chloride channel family protein
MLNYLRATEIEVGLLFNFGIKPEFRRLVLRIQKTSTALWRDFNRRITKTTSMILKQWNTHLYRFLSRLSALIMAELEVHSPQFNGLDVFGINLGDLMEVISAALFSYDDDYYWTREQTPQDTSLDALRRALLEALMDQRLLSQHQIQQMLDENEGKYEGSQLQEMLNQLIERLVDEGYLKLHEEPQSEQPREMMGNGEGRIEEPLPRNVKFEVTEKGLDFLGYKALRNLLGSLGQSSIGRHDTMHLATGVEAEAASKPYEFGDTINLDVNTTLLSAIQREGLSVPINLEYKDLHVHQCDYQSSCATVVMLDCSHSMILYGEDRFTPAKKVALALAHLIRTQYPGDSLKIVLFHDSAEELPLAKLATTQVGPYHEHG